MMKILPKKDCSENWVDKEPTILRGQVDLFDKGRVMTQKNGKSSTSSWWKR